MAEKRVAVMVPEGVRDWLQEECRRLEVAAQAHWYESPLLQDSKRDGNEPRVTIARLIEAMLEQRREHRARRRKAKLNRQSAKPRTPSARALANAGRADR